MDGLIIAAGQGLRLREKGTCKPLTVLLDRPLIEHVITRAIKGGIERFVVILGYQAERLGEFLEQLSQKLKIPIQTVFNDEWEKENGISVLKAKSLLSNPFVLMMSDHVFDPNIIKELINQKKSVVDDSDYTFLCVDHALTNPLVDLDDVTKVLSQNGRIVDISKNLENFNCFDTGIFLCSPTIFPALETSINRLGNGTLSGAMRVLAQSGTAKTFDVTGSFWIDVDDDAAYSKAEHELKR